MSEAGSACIRVLHLGSPTGLYGAERWILALARHLPSARVESWVGAIEDSGKPSVPLCDRAVELGLRVQVFKSAGKLSLSAIAQLKRFIREHGIDVLHTHGYKTDIIGRLAAWGTGCRTVATPHGWCGGAGARLRLYEALDRLCFVFFDAIAPLSAGMHDGLKRFPGLSRRLHLIPNGVDIEELESESPLAAPVAAWRAAGGVVVGYIGRLDAGKRVDTLVRAFHRLDIAAKYLCIVGDGPTRPELERLAAALGEAGRVAFVGFRADRLALLKGFDLFVLPSESEGIPRCLMEAMGAGIPVIASDIPGCRNLVEEGSTGVLFEPGDDAGLAEQMRRLLERPDLRAQLARSGRERVRTCFSAESMASRYLRLYESLGS